MLQLRRQKRNVPLPHLLAKSRAMNRSSTLGSHDTPMVEPPNLLDRGPVDVGGTVYGLTSDTPEIEIGDIRVQPSTQDIAGMLKEEVLQNKIELEFQLKSKHISRFILANQKVRKWSNLRNKVSF